MSKAAADSEQAAIRKYDSLRAPDSPTSRLYRAHVEDLRRHSAPLLRSPNWPETLAEQCVQEARADVRPGFLSGGGEFKVLPDETFANYHARRQVMVRFNRQVVASSERNSAQYPDTDDPATPLAKKRSAKAALLRENQSAFFEYPDWPERLTARCLKEDS